ncbi:purine-nucleoside phosphorylase [Thermomicrobium sp. 4228-Ro]|uniref:purine-nucleoside phosphorylase n=1 Tax=Thermomicrobium sp. 4228-Ro TaxID=2993937 RepID=UPI00224971BC|nr:purine-nucleoside phosphorylase [Thermomicrobium sp. 4228-Ro]MCX2727335.1 purine-nucleoside phosphorylase [Thermomicrobium sp. 4228-Ro]
MRIPLHPWQERAADRAAELAAESGLAPLVFVVLGSGLGALPAGLVVEGRVVLDEVTGIAATAVPGHARELVLARWDGVPVWLCLGRYHLYQGLTAAQVAAPVAMLAKLPVRSVLLTNAAGGLNPSLNPGDLVLVRDHLAVPSLAGQHPLVPPAGPVQFFSLRDAYDPGLRSALRATAASCGVTLTEGTYAWVAGPTFETPAELRWLRLAGADVVGMSTVPEVIMARALGFRVAALSVVTNRAVPEEPLVPTHEEVTAIGEQARPRLFTLLRTALPRLVGDEPASQ